MTFMSKGRKQDLIKLATELGEEMEGDFKVIELRELILKTCIYKEDLDFVKATLENIMIERIERDERERVADEKERIEWERAYELEKFRLQVKSQKLKQTSSPELLPADQQATFNLKKLLPDFDPQDGDMTLFLNLFERQIKILKIMEKLDSYDNLRSVNLKLFPKPHETKVIYPKRNQYQSTRFEQRDDSQGLPWIPSQNRRDPNYKDRSTLSCYGCGAPEVVKAKCAKCNPMVQGDSTQTPTLNHMNFHRISMENFLRAAGIILDLQKGLWYFSEAPHQSFNFIEPPADIKSLLVVPVASHPCQLLENEGTHLTDEQRTKFNSLPKRYEKCFQPGGEPTPVIGHRINTEIQAFSLKVLYVAGKANVVADMLSRPVCDEKESPYEVCNIAIADLPVRSAKDMLEAQLADENLKKIIDSFESTQKTEDYANWTERGFLMNQGVLYRYLPDADSEEAQLVIPSSERDSIMEKNHDDTMTATASECAITLIDDIFLRYGIPRRIISDNGSQFVSAVLQQVCCTLNFSQNLIPVYFPQSNPVERKNRDLKPRLAILVGDDHGNWHSKLPMIRFAMNTAVCDTIGHTPAFLQLGRELRTVDDVVRDFKAVVENDNFVPEITPYLKRFANFMNELRERIEMKQDRRETYYDKNRKQVFYSPGDKVWVTSYPISNKFKRKTSKFVPRRDGPYIILTQRSPTTYEIASPSDPSTTLGTYHTSALRSYSQNMEADTPLHLIRKRGRPPKLKSLFSGTNRPPDNSNSSFVFKMFKNARKIDLQLAATELGVVVTDKMTIVDLTNIIKNTEKFKDEPEFVSTLIEGIIENRKIEVETIEKSKQLELQLEQIKLERAKAEIELSHMRAVKNTREDDSENKIEQCDSLD
ncbi:Gag-Pol polyprotein-like protein [Argiope bruennichi]|uniref:Gag-Pol polyprotein-like protein n=1 Tax=Argiope bruennichi TaxID=94029 RepID=A0A8T0FWE3_ARGBR|nr:Gag-Pol polyprotein-like protein [Argiope bruennichi]